MASPQIKILITLSGISIVYAFICDIKLSNKASKTRQWLERERPELWRELNAFARNWHGGHPGLKLLYRRNEVDLPEFDEQYAQLHALERKLLWGLAVGAVGIGLVAVGTRFWGWQW